MTRLKTLVAALCGTLGPHVDASFVEMVVVPTTVIRGADTFFVYRGHAKFSSPTDGLLSCHGVTLPTNCIYWHTYPFSGGGSNVAGSWSPAFTSPSNAQLDSYVNIGTFLGFGSDIQSPENMNNPCDPPNEWSNSNPFNMFGQPDPQTLLVFVGQFVFRNTAPSLTTPITIVFNQGLGTPPQFATASFTVGFLDANGDGEVAAQDITLVIGWWGPCGSLCPADIDRNGTVDAADLSIVMAAWGECP